MEMMLMFEHGNDHIIISLSWLVGKRNVYIILGILGLYSIHHVHACISMHIYSVLSTERTLPHPILRNMDGAEPRAVWIYYIVMHRILVPQNPLNHHHHRAWFVFSSDRAYGSVLPHKSHPWRAREKNPISHHINKIIRMWFVFPLICEFVLTVHYI